MRSHPRAAAGPRGAEHVACKRLDLDDVGPEIAEHLRGVRAQHDGSEVEDADAGE